MIETGPYLDVRAVYGATLVSLGEMDDRIVVLDADLMKASGGDQFMKRYAERHFQLGIAEQNLVSVAAGLAAMGKIPFASAFASFLSQRACDQVVNSVAFNRFNVKLCGTYAGLSQEKNGGTHIGVADIAIMRALPNMVVLAPGDCTELGAVLRWAATYEGPVYVRMARGPLRTIFTGEYRFELGKAIRLGEGEDATIITTDITTLEGVVARNTLEARGIYVRHLHLPTLQPIDQDEIFEAAKETKAIVTVENHSRQGGLGSAVTEVVCERYPVPVLRLGIDDRFGETASLGWLMNKFGISAPHIVEAVERVLQINAGG
jgi:transketolase